METYSGKNRRKVAAPRTKAGSKAILTVLGKRIGATLMNFSNSGIRIETSIIIPKIRTGDKVEVEYVLAGVKMVNGFSVCSVVGKSIGLRYSDGRNLSQQQRITDSHNKKTT